MHTFSVLYNLHYRFVEQKTIYTYCGIVLVAINPYEDCSHLYGQEMIQVYRGVGKQVRGLDPHVYAVAEEAIFDMSEYGKNQSIIVSGESGAGKTVSAKFAMRYFAAVGSARSSSSLTGIEDRVLASNPIMEAIGNAKTIRNDNSSRFGKFIQINFTERFAIAGAEMKTYLLEKSRVVFQAQNERNYHVFYQMCAAKDDAMLKNLHLEDAVNYFYTGQGGHGRIAGVDDRADFAETTKAFGLLGINADQQKDIFRVLAGLLQLGNISFASGGDEIAVVEASMQQGIKRLCSDLYEIDSTALDTWLTVREIRAAGDTLRKPLNTSEAIASRDALAKVLYSAVFAWIVHKVNESLVEKAPTPSPRKQHVDPMSTATPATPTTSSKGNRFIGVLDIYGFETFDINSFEQFCINYANEKLQQQFNQHVFKLEQEEYEREEIAWVRIDFYDNQPCIDLIEDKLGLIDLLDEQCRMGRGTDVDWLNQLRSSVALKTKPHFELPKIQEPAFIVKHFAADVTYRVDGFLDKNKDTVSEQLLEVIKKSKFPFLREILGVEEQTATNGTGYSAVRVTNDSGPQKKQNKKTVSCQFRDSLRDLMMILGSTRPHYVRCIKPNDQKASFTFDPKRAIQQLRACGVLETVRISAAGYPSRWLYDDFGKRYRVLYPEGKAMWRDQPKKFAEKACAKWIDDHSKFALGKSKIFFRTGQVAQLERLRSETLAKSALVIQKIWRGYVARQRYLKIRASIRTIQAVGRAFLAYRRMKYIQMHRAAVCLQRRVRGWLARVKYVRARKTVLALQSLYRANLVRRRVQKLRYEQKAIIIQKYCRGWLVRRSQIEYKRKVIKVQSCVRRWLAKRRLRELKVEARSVGHLQKLNSGLENKIISLQLKLDQASLDNGKLVDQCADVEKLRVEVAHMTTLKGEMTSLKDKHDELEQEVERLATECDIKDAHLTEAQTKLEQMNIQLEQLTAQHEREMAALQAAVDGGRSAALQLSAAKDKLESQLENESRKREHAEQRVSLLSEQLMSNANLLAGSPGLSRVGSMRGSRSPIPLDLNQGTLGDKDELLLTIRQQRLITELTARNEHLAREREQLRSLMEANSQLADMERKTSLRLFEAQRVQELEVAYAKLKSELERLVEEKTSKGADKMNIQSLVDRTLEENDRLDISSESFGLWICGFLAGTAFWLFAKFSVA
uniref:Myosin motor domain-containing protein n=1 Tax=Plectus sambesii TaxID=2011161 RepID=A0A914WZP3_9BILA